MENIVEKSNRNIEQMLREYRNRAKKLGNFEAYCIARAELGMIEALEGSNQVSKKMVDWLDSKINEISEELIKEQ